MNLNEKIASLPPEARDEVELFVDYLISRLGAGQVSPPGYADIPAPEPASFSPPVQRSPIPGKYDSSGILLAEERISKKENGFETIDFADINTRFAPPEQPEKDVPTKRQARMFDWL